MAATFVRAANGALSGSTTVATFSAGVGSGSFIVVAGGFDRVATGVTIINGSGNTVTIVDPLFDNASTGIRSFVQAFFTPTPGVTTVTASYTGSPTFADLVIWEFSGLVSPTFDKVVHGSASSGTLADSGASGTLSSTDEAAIGYFDTGGTFSAGSTGAGWSTATGDGFLASLGSFSEHRVVAANTAINATASLANASWTAHLATFMAGVTNTIMIADQARS